MLCAQPSSCNSRYASMNGSVIHPPGRFGDAQPRITRSNCKFVVHEYRRKLRLIDLVTRRESSGMIPRSSGDHHAMSSTPNAASAGIGKIPCRYAEMSVDGARSAPRPTRSLAGQLSGLGNRHTDCGSGVGGCSNMSLHHVVDDGQYEKNPCFVLRPSFPAPTRDFRVSAGA